MYKTYIPTCARCGDSDFIDVETPKGIFNKCESCSYPWIRLEEEIGLTQFQIAQIREAGNNLSTYEVMKLSGSIK